jgi:hypothetical protein
VLFAVSADRFDRLAQRRLAGCAAAVDAWS